MSDVQRFYLGLFGTLGIGAIVTLVTGDLTGEHATGLLVAAPLAGFASLVAMDYKFRVSENGGASEP
ncbi:hypothetical protein [Natrialba sp. SSL1]|uniref:hypothetical protein n=1 Tax=Natrialba sp. SSL1 TaxID=1869245 RepID=UPI0008F84D1B|nr:hypothetical protein [Natrialba sp. SSL1]OIB58180.1 hypothetical protein BBD46_09890 [Natrialba sp. SSL1]OIB58181.1 hypothetical protein BBD46_09900 [Natrialba sp. SSL1]